jgi:hypothetical protein
MLNKILRAAVKAGLLSLCLVSPAFSAVTRYAAPAPIRLSSDYTILATVGQSMSLRLPPICGTANIPMPILIFRAP